MDNYKMNFRQKNFDPALRHSMEYYTDYISSFEPATRRKIFYRFIKRLFDILFSVALLVLLFPVFILIAAMVKLDSPGPAIFRQQRVGKGGKPFTCLKFRSMRIDAPHDKATSQLRDPARYVTRVGKFLRKFSLDELPQIWCVFIGTMSFIGYRPLILSENNCNNMRARLGVFSMRPGISGYAQVHGRDDLYYKNKAIMDAEYVKTASVWLDIKLLFHTLLVVCTKKGNWFSLTNLN